MSVLLMKYGSAGCRCPGAPHYVELKKGENATIGTIGTKVNDLTVARGEEIIRSHGFTNPQSWTDRTL